MLLIFYVITQSISLQQGEYSSFIMFVKILKRQDWNIANILKNI